MKLAWSPVLPPAAASIEPPPVPSLIDHYVIGYDEVRAATFYVVPRQDDARGSEVWSFDGKAWTVALPKRFERMDGRIEGGGWDSARGGVALWSVHHDYQHKRHRVAGWVNDAKGPRAIEAKGDEPLLEAEGNDDIGTFDKKAAFAFDRAREVWVCLTRCGIWELAKDGTWSKKHDGAGIPRSWDHATGTGIYDPRAKRCVFSMQDGDSDGDYDCLLFGWDGTTLASIPMKGLPKLMIGLFDPAFQIAGHPRHGVVLQIGKQLFALGDGSWSELPAAKDAPPRMQSAHMSYDAKLDALVLGPGKHEGAGGSEYQRVFFLLRDGQWERQGRVISHSALKSASYGNCRLAHVGGVWYGTGTHSLRTWKWNVPNWDEVVGKDVGEKVGGWEILELLGGERLRAIMQSGAVFEFDGTKTWTAVRKADPAFKKRTDFAFAQDGNGRIVVWGGEANGRKLNDTLFLEGKTWRVAKKSSPQPADFKHGNKDSVYVGTTMVWDSALGAFVRFGYEDAAVLGPDDVWTFIKPKGYKSLISERCYGHAPVHDAATGETLLVDFENKRVLRFDLASLTEVATFAFPPELEPARQHDAAAYHALAQSFSWDPSTRSLYAQKLEDSAGVYRLDLGPVFDHASTLGPRKLLAKTASAASGTPAKAEKAKPASAPAFEPTRLYRLHRGTVTFVAAAPKGKTIAKLGEARRPIALTTGVVGTKGTTKVVALEAATKLLAARRKEGFAPARELSRDVLVALAGVPSSAVRVGKAVKSGALPKSRLGGAPALVSGKAWPHARKKPMGFLFQIETGALLKKHAGVAVFCSLDGEATTEDGENAAVLLRAADFAKKGQAPAGVAALPVRELTIADAKIEIDEERAHALGAIDPEILTALEAFQAKKGMQESGLAMKVGGVPQFLQGDSPLKGWTFVAQLDFDTIDVSKTWPDAGLSGCVYVFVKNDEKDAVAFWQYT